MNQAEPVDEKYSMWWQKYFTETEKCPEPKLSFNLHDSEEFNNFQDSNNKEVLKFKPRSVTRYTALTDLLEKKCWSHSNFYNQIDFFRSEI